MTRARYPFAAAAALLLPALLALGCTPPTPVTRCNDTRDCPANFHCDLEHSFCVHNSTDSDAATADASATDLDSIDRGPADTRQPDAVQTDRGATDQGPTDVRPSDAAAADRASSDRLSTDAAGAERFDAGNRDSTTADAAVRDAGLDDHGHHDAAAGDWWNPAWRLRTRLTIDNTQGSEDLVDFPLLVELTADHFDFAAARSDLRDVRFVSAGGEELAAELDSHEAAPRALYWVSVPLVSAGMTTTIWVYHGNPAAAASNRVASEVWSHYAGAWHLGQLDQVLPDSTVNDSDLQSFGASVAVGQIGAGQSLAGNSSNLHTLPAEPSALAITGDLTVSIWAHIRSLDSNANYTLNLYANPLVVCSAHTGTKDNYEYAVNIGGDLRLRSYWESPSVNVCASSVLVGNVSDQWHHYAFTRAAGRRLTNFYIDGEPVGDPLGFQQIANAYTNTALWIGADQYDVLNLNLDAVVDEVRVEPVARSAAWIFAIHHSEQLQMVSFGQVEGY